jgi:hypothetical protein
MAKVDLPVTSDSYESLRWLRSVPHDRLRAYELLVHGMRKNNDKMVDDALAELKLVQARNDQRSTIGGGAAESMTC